MKSDVPSYDGLVLCAYRPMRRARRRFDSFINNAYSGAWEVPGTVAGHLLVDLDALDVDGWLVQGAAACAAALPDLPSGLPNNSA